MENLQNIEVNAKQAAQALGISQGTLRKLYIEGRTGDFVVNKGNGSHLHLVVRLGDIEDLKALVEEHTRRSRAVRSANGEVIMSKLDALARAVKYLSDTAPNLHDEDREAVERMLMVGGFDLSVETAGATA